MKNLQKHSILQYEMDLGLSTSKPNGAKNLFQTLQKSIKKSIKSWCNFSSTFGRFLFDFGGQVGIKNPPKSVPNRLEGSSKTSSKKDTKNRGPTGLGNSGGGPYNWQIQPSRGTPTGIRNIPSCLRGHGGGYLPLCRKINPSKDKSVKLEESNQSKAKSAKRYISQ